MRNLRLLSLRAAGALSFLAFVAGCGQAKDSEDLGRTKQALSTGLVISQVYGGAGSSGAPYKYEYVELFNRGSSDVTVSGWTIQYRSATGTGGWSKVATIGDADAGSSVTIGAGKYFLVKFGSGSGDGADFTADLTSSTGSFGAGGGKIALVDNSATLATTATPTEAGIVDFLGYGNANQHEGSGAALETTFTKSVAAARKDGGCTETDDNAADFELLDPPAPRNLSTAAHSCGSDAGTTDAADAAEDAADAADAADDAIVLVDTGADETAPSDAGEDAAPSDAGEDAAPSDAGDDATPTDAGDDAATDAGDDSATTDAGDDTAPADAGDDTGTEEDTGTVEDTGTTPADTGTKPPTDTGVADTGGPDVAPPEATADDSGCGCRVAGTGDRETTTAGLGALVALGAVVARRRRR